MNILIVEDEAPAARRLRRLVAADLKIDPNVIAVVDTLDAARQYIAERRVNVLFLDLDLSGRDGFELLQAARTDIIATVIVSANVHRAVDAFDHNVVDFVAKPVSATRLSRALARAREARSGEMRLVVHSQGRTDIIPASKIVHISGAVDYVEVFVETDQSFLHNEKLDILEKSLPASFVRAHRSHIVNMSHVIQLRVLGRDQHALLTASGKEIPVSRRRARAVRTALEAKVLR